MIREGVLWLFVLNLGIVFGAGLYETRIAVPRWLRGSPATGYRWDAAAARADDVGLRFWAFVSTMPLTLLTLASLALSWTEPEPGPARALWLGAALVALCERAMTFGYFIPTMVGLMGEGGADDPGAARRARRWVRLGLLRHAATLCAWLLALQALVRLHAGR